VVENTYAWVRRYRAQNERFSKDEMRQLIEIILEGYVRGCSWRHFSVSILVQCFNQFDRWIEASEKTDELEDLPSIG
jgi:hypothetical protein